MLAFETLETGKPAEVLIIWLHGLGADGFDFMPVVPMLGLSPRLKARFCFPHAPARPVTLNQGYEMPAWFDLFHLSLDGREDAAGLQEAGGWIDELRSAHPDIPDNRVAVVGFSQGAALALHYGLRAKRPVAGIVGISGYLPLSAEYPRAFSATAQQTPVLLLHGEADSVVPVAATHTAVRLLQNAKCRVQGHFYPGLGHEVGVPQLQQVGHFLNTTLLASLAT